MVTGKLLGDKAKIWNPGFWMRAAAICQPRMQFTLSFILLAWYCIEKILVHAEVVCFAISGYSSVKLIWELERTNRKCFKVESLTVQYLLAHKPHHQHVRSAVLQTLHKSWGALQHGQWPLVNLPWREGAVRVCLIFAIGNVLGCLPNPIALPRLQDLGVSKNIVGMGEGGSKNSLISQWDFVWMRYSLIHLFVHSQISVEYLTYI